MFLQSVANVIVVLFGISIFGVPTAYNQVVEKKCRPISGCYTEREVLELRPLAVTYNGQVKTLESHFSRGEWEHIRIYEIEGPYVIFSVAGVEYIQPRTVGWTFSASLIDESNVKE